MDVLDTNILSAIMSLRGSPEVARWITSRRQSALFTTSVSQAEIYAELAIMPDGRRRSGLEAAARLMFVEDFAGRVLPFDVDAAAAYPHILAARRRAGRPIATLDLMIVSIALSRGAAVVTRDAAGFAGCGVPVIDPWAPNAA